jgi:hypothetical protein
MPANKKRSYQFDLSEFKSAPSKVWNERFYSTFKQKGQPVTPRYNERGN